MADQPVAVQLNNADLPPGRAVTVNRTRNHNQLVHVRDRLFQTIFYKSALAYARAFPRPLRRLIEFVVLLKAFMAFFVLVYIHFAFSKSSNTCLNSAISNWPRDGVLRIEIVRDMEPGYSLEHSYAKEERLNRLVREDMGALLGLLTTRMDLEPSTIESVDKETEALSANMSFATISPSPTRQEGEIFANSSLNASSMKMRWKEMFTERPFDFSLTENAPDENLTFNQPLPALDPKFIESKSIDRNDVYILEYALEYGFLKLSPATRTRLNIPVKTVFLDRAKHECFGDSFSRLLLEEFLGYNDILMISVKAFAEKERNRGYLKNIVTNEHYRFVNLWMARTAYIPAAICMLIFTVIVSMLLRYAHHQIFVFIVDLLQMLEFNLSITFPAAPLLTVILALVGIEAVMSEFFNDTTTAFYVILIVWLADQYDAICCHTPLTKRHWLKFFYLYHFVFYAYHYRFNGQYTGLSLIVHWLFIQHSMIYFFHHYELPVILQQAQFEQILLRSAQQHAQGGVNPPNVRNFPHLRGRFTQFLSAVRPTATTQTSNIVVASVSAVATSTVATSTSSIATVSATRNTVTVGTNAQPISASQSIQTVAARVETADSQTSTGTPVMEAVSIQTNDEGSRPPHGGPDQP